MKLRVKKIKHYRGRYRKSERELGLTLWRGYEGTWTLNLGLWTHWHVWDLL